MAPVKAQGWLRLCSAFKDFLVRVEVREQGKQRRVKATVVGMGRWSGEEGRCRGKLSWRWVHLSRAWKDGCHCGQQRWRGAFEAKGPAGARESSG